MKSIFAVLFTCALLFNCSGNKEPKLTLKVRGNCEMCKERIEATTQLIPGVSSAKWDVSSQILTVSYDSLNNPGQKLDKALADAGHGTENIEATKESDNALPPCCRKGADFH